MNVLPLLGGLALGFLAGWIVFGSGTGTAPPPTPATPPVHEPREAGRPVPSDVVENAARPAVDVVAALRSGAVEKIRSLLETLARP